MSEETDQQGTEVADGVVEFLQMTNPAMATALTKERMSFVRVIMNLQGNFSQLMNMLRRSGDRYWISDNDLLLLKGSMAMQVHEEEQRLRLAGVEEPGEGDLPTQDEHMEDPAGADRRLGEAEVSDRELEDQS